MVVAGHILITTYGRDARGITAAGVFVVHFVLVWPRFLEVGQFSGSQGLTCGDTCRSGVGDVDSRGDAGELLWI